MHYTLNQINESHCELSILGPYSSLTNTREYNLDGLSQPETLRFISVNLKVDFSTLPDQVYEDIIYDLKRIKFTAIEIDCRYLRNINQETSKKIAKIFQASGIFNVKLKGCVVRLPLYFFASILPTVQFLCLDDNASLFLSEEVWKYIGEAANSRPKLTLAISFTETNRLSNPSEDLPADIENDIDRNANFEFELECLNRSLQCAGLQLLDVSNNNLDKLNGIQWGYLCNMFTSTDIFFLIAANNNLGSAKEEELGGVIDGNAKKCFRSHDGLKRLTYITLWKKLDARLVQESIVTPDQGVEQAAFILHHDNVEKGNYRFRARILPDIAEFVAEQHSCFGVKF